MGLIGAWNLRSDIMRLSRQAPGLRMRSFLQLPARELEE
jgi:hypothetical protein